MQNGKCFREAGGVARPKEAECIVLQVQVVPGMWRYGVACMTLIVGNVGFVVV